MKKIGLIWTNPYSGNRGVGALTYSILYILNNISKEFNEEFQYYILGTGNQQGKDLIDLGFNIVPVVNLSNKFLNKGWKGAIKNVIAYSTFTDYSSLDYIMDIGEGDSYTDIYGIERFDNLNKTKLFFIRKNIRQLLLPQTIGPFNNEIVRKKAFSTLSKCSMLLVRDKQSYNYLKQNIGEKNLSEIIDVAFFMPYEKKYFSNEFIHVGLNISALLWNGGYTRNNQFNLIDEYQMLIRNIIDYFKAIPNLMLHLVPHVVEDRFGVENDYAISYQLVEEFKNENILLAPFFLNPILAKNYIAGMDFFVGARMHSAIAAFSTGVPVYPMAYSRKFNGLFVDTLDYKFMGDLVNQKNSEILTGIKEAFEHREELKVIIQKRMDTTVKERGKLLNQKLVNFLGLKK